MSYLLRRLEFFAITLWAALTVNFLLPRLMPGSPAEAMLVRFHGRDPEQWKKKETTAAERQAVVRHLVEWIPAFFSGYAGLPLATGPSVELIAFTGRQP